MSHSGHELEAARSQIRSGHPREAKGILEAALAAEPDNAEATWLLAEVEVSQGDLDRAVGRAKRLSDRGQASSEALYKFGVCLHRHGKSAEAVPWYRAALRGAPQALEPWCNLGAALQSLGREEEAVEAYEQALKLKPDFPEVLGNVGNAHLALRQHAKAAEVLTKALALKPEMSTAWNSLGIALRNLGRTDEACVAYERAIALNTGYAEAHANLGTLHKAAGRPDRAEPCYRHSLRLAPGKADVLNNLGGVLNELGRHSEAALLLREAIAKNPHSADAHSNLGNAQLAADDLDGASQSLLRALEIRPGNVEALCNLGNLHLARNRLDDALSCYEQAEHSVPGHAEALFNQSLVHLARGDFPRGWPLYERRFEARKGHPARAFAGVKRLASDTSIAGRTIFVHAEQGLGDTIQFARFLPVLREAGARVRTEVQTPLFDLISASGLADSVHTPQGAAPADCELFCPLLSLPHVLRFDPLRQTAPKAYLTVPDAARAAWSPHFEGSQGPRVGFVWSGNPKHRNDRRRSIALERLLDSFAAFSGTMVSLQKERSAADRAVLGQWAGLLDLGPGFKDFSDTAAVVAQLDLVVTVDTSVAHLAGALGVATCVLLPFAPDWRWMLEREDSPWYPSMGLFRQAAAGDWESVLAKVRGKLAGLCRRSPVS